MALVGGGIGAAFGAILPFVVSWLFGAIIPLPLAPALHLEELLLALLYGLLTALVFALWPLGRAHDVPVAELFRDIVELQPRWPRKRYIAFTALAVLILATFAVLMAYDRRVALIYVAAAAAVFLLLRVIATLMMILASRAPRARTTGLRMAVANIHRPSALTPTIVLSLGLGITLLVTVIEIDGNLSRQFANELPARAPSFYFLDIPADQSERFAAFLRTQAPSAHLEEVPMLRGRIVSAAGIPAENIKPKEDAAWALQGDRGLTYATRFPAARDWSKENGGRPTMTGLRSFRSRSALPMASVSNWATPSSSMSLGAMSPRRSPTCELSIGRALASIS